MKSYTLFPFLSCAGSVAGGMYQGMRGYSEDLTLMVIGGCSVVGGTCMLLYSVSNQSEIPVSWREDVQNPVRFGVFFGAGVGTVSLGAGYVLGKAAELGLERFL